MSKTKQWAPYVAVILLMFFENINPAAAQLTRGFVSGIVTDTTNGVMAGVQITLTSKATSITRSTLTNETGFYRFAGVEPAEYSLEFKIAGFETHRIESLTVNAAQEVVINQVLNVSSVAGEVSVEATGIALDKTMSSIERTFSAQTVADM